MNEIHECLTRQDLALSFKEYVFKEKNSPFCQFQAEHIENIKCTKRKLQIVHALSNSVILLPGGVRKPLCYHRSRIDSIIFPSQNYLEEYKRQISKYENCENSKANGFS